MASPTTPSNGFSAEGVEFALAGAGDDDAGSTTGALGAAGSTSGLAADTAVVTGADEALLALGAALCAGAALAADGAGIVAGDDGVSAAAVDVDAVLGASGDCANALDRSTPNMSATNVGLVSARLENAEGNLLGAERGELHSICVQIERDKKLGWKRCTHSPENITRTKVRAMLLISTAAVNQNRAMRANRGRCFSIVAAAQTHQLRWTVLRRASSPMRALSESLDRYRNAKTDWFCAPTRWSTATSVHPERAVLVPQSCAR